MDGFVRASRGIGPHRYGVLPQLTAGLEDATVLPGKHLLQEENAPKIAGEVYRLAEQSRTRGLRPARK